MTSGRSLLAELRGVAKRWDASSGLAPVDLTVRRGEIVVLRGRSGSGKSTLLALLAEWCLPDAGELVRGEALVVDDSWRRWQGTAIVPQVLGLVGELSVAENVEIVLRLSGVGRNERRAMVAEVLARLDLTEHADRLPRETSLGQQQRVAVARATVSSPTLLLADEPTCHQDALHGAAVLAALRRVADAGGGVLVASHDDAVVAVADRVVSLDD
ncbi:MAG: ABC transporter ATP-binding protein [Acidimicrobiia bacterium]